MAGIEYLIASDTAELRAFPSTESNGIWVIRKQDRKIGSINADVEVLKTYFIVNNNVFMASSLGDIINNRLVSSNSNISMTLAHCRGSLRVLLLSTKLSPQCLTWPFSHLEWGIRTIHPSSEPPKPRTTRKAYLSAAKEAPSQKLNPNLAHSLPAQKPRPTTPSLHKTPARSLHLSSFRKAIRRTTSTRTLSGASLAPSSSAPRPTASKPTASSRTPPSDRRKRIVVPSVCKRPQCHHQQQ